MINPIRPREGDIEKICGLVQEKLGIKFDKKKTALIISRLSKRLRDLDLDSYGEYLDRVERDPDEEIRMFNFLSTNVTQFFREPQQFEFLRDKVFPSLLAKKKEKTVRCWSAGCASGEEAYTLAMLMREHFPADWSPKVLASDINTASLQYGTEGVYTQEEIKNIPERLLKKYFIPQTPQTYQVGVDLRRMLFFRRINLLDEAMLPADIRFDFIFCRNVFIYFSKEAQIRVIDSFHRHLYSGGYLFLGHSEAMDTLGDERWLPMKGCIFQKHG